MMKWGFTYGSVKGIANGEVDSLAFGAGECFAV
jgi:hypothetical protein